MEPGCRMVRGAIHLARGDLAAALAEASRATELARAVKDPQSLNPSLAFEVRARLALGDLAGASALADELVAALTEKGIWGPYESVDGAWAFRQLDRAAELIEAFERPRAQTPWHEAARRILAGDLAGAADLYAEIGSVPDEAYARLRATEELMRSGLRGEADRQLRLALPVFARLGAAGWAAEGEALLAASA
jgi:hypothetical protein